MAEIDLDDLKEALRPIAREDTLRQLAKLPDELKNRDERRDNQSKNQFSKLTGALNQWADNATDSLAKGIVGTTGLLTTQGNRLSDVMSIMKDTAGGLPPVFNTLGEVIASLGTSFTGYVEDTADSFRALRNVGGGLNGRLTELRIASADARLGLDTFTNIVQSNSEALAGFQGGVEGGVRRLSAMSRELFEFQQGRIADTFLNLGYSIEEMNEFMADNIALSRRQARLEGLSASEQIEKAAEFAKQLDIVAKLTGKEADALRNEIRERQRSGATQAALRSMEAQGQENVQEIYNNVQTELAKGPQVLQDLFDDVTQLGVPLTEATRNFAAVNSEAYNLVQESQRAMEQGDIDRAMSLAREAAAETANFAQSEEGRQLARLQQVSDVGAQQAQVLEETSSVIDAVKANAEDFEDASGDFVEIFERLNQDLQTVQAEQVQATNRPLLGLITESEQALANIPAAIQREMAEIIQDRRISQGIEEFTARLEGTLTPERIQELSDSLANTLVNTRSDLDNARRALRQAQEQGLPRPEIAQLEQVVSELENAYQTLEDPSVTGTEREEAISQTRTLPVRIEEIADNLDLPITMRSEDTRERLSRSAEERREQGDPQGAERLEQFTENETLFERLTNLLPSFANGTLGQTNRLIRDFESGTLALLHGREAVLTENQLQNFAQGAYQSGVSSGLERTTQNQNVNLADSMNNLQGVEINLDNSDLVSAISSLNEAIDNLPNKLDQGSGQDKTEQIANTISNAIGQVASRLDSQTNIAKRQLQSTRGQSDNLYKGI